MLKKIAILLGVFLAGSLAADAAGPRCTADVVATPRSGGSWPSGDGIGQIYDITVHNGGSCPLTDVGLSISGPEGSRFISYWNLEPTVLYDLLANFGDSLAVGSSATAGVILQLPTTTVANLSIQVYGAACPDDCLYPTSAPTSSPSPSPTSTPTEPPTTICEDIDARLETTSSWEQDGVPTSSYALFITNNGSCPLVAYTTGFGYFPGTIVQSWNLESSLGGYMVVGYGSSLAPGQTYGGAGLIIANATNGVQVQPYGAACQC